MAKKSNQNQEQAAADKEAKAKAEAEAAAVDKARAEADARTREEATKKLEAAAVRAEAAARATEEVHARAKEAADKLAAVQESRPDEKAQFLVPSSMRPGVERSGVGFFRPGNVMTLPDPASLRDKDGVYRTPVMVPAKLVPLNETAKVMLEESVAYLRYAKERAVLMRATRKIAAVAGIPANALDILADAKDQARRDRQWAEGGQTVRELGKS